MWSRVSEYARRHSLLDASRLYIVALSGGADSVALLLLLHEHGFNVHAAHCNFHLRGSESDRDEAFCADLCRRLGVELHRAHFDTTAYAEAHRVSIELAARELRYRWFEQLREDIGAADVCVAHHRDDQVETVLMNLVRGAGVRGMAGIRPRNGHVVRPLLCVTRDEIEHFLTSRGQSWVTDSTNLADDATRNRVRHQLVPLLSALNPQSGANIRRMAERMQDVAELLTSYKEQALQRQPDGTLCLVGRPLLNTYLLYECVRDYGFSYTQAEQAFEAFASGATGRGFTSASHDLLVDRGRLLVAPRLQPLKPLVIPECGTYVVDDRHRLRVNIVGRRVSTDPRVATLDADKVAFPLTVRRAGAADRMVPYGMRGSRLVSDMMTDMKLSMFDKRQQLVVVDAQGVIVWLVCRRVNARAAVTDGTSRVVELAI